MEDGSNDDRKNGWQKIMRTEEETDSRGVKEWQDKVHIEHDETEGSQWSADENLPRKKM